MLRNRQEGIVNLHGLWATALVAFLFLFYCQLYPILGGQFVSDTQDIYLFGIIAASLFNIRLYKAYASEFSSLTFGQTFRLTYQQTFRIALIMFAIYFSLKDVGASRVFLGTFLSIAFVALFAINKIIPRRLCRISFKTQVIRTAIIGTPKALGDLQKWTSQKTDFGIEIVGYIPETPCPPKSEQGEVPCLGQVEDIEQILEQNQISQVVLLQNALSKGATNVILKKAQKVGCRVRIYNNWQEQYNHRIVVEHEGEHTFLTLEDEPLENPINRSMKRALDIAISLPIVAFVLPPLTVFVWFFQKRQSPGPIFYAQPRTGMTKRTFHIIKFRTMHSSDENSANVAKQATKGDSRVYPFGCLLRKTSLDELPQFINVLLGDMSVSGPRPHLINHDKEFSETLNAYYTRHFVKPGITGLAQSKGFRGEITEHELLKRRVSYDIFYVNNWSLMLDIKIIFMTIKTIIFPPKTAY
ncbi:MAG: sugar transferase [Verrucomicrobiota bacterium]